MHVMCHQNSMNIINIIYIFYSLILPIVASWIAFKNLNFALNINHIDFTIEHRLLIEQISPGGNNSPLPLTLKAVHH